MSNPLERRETLALRSWAILGVGLGTAAFLALVMAGLFLLYRWAQAPERYSPPERFAPPRLETDPAAALRDFRAAQAAQLEAGDDPPRRAVAEAMALIAARGAAAYDPLEPPAAPPPPTRREAAP
ncbi:hypothetical protein [Teichococcus aestuarii]|uniref:hypothetical protein n=1 Tax=Teichococcus aestuarii TaxID=568898 RepID=UPI003607C7C9